MSQSPPLARPAKKTIKNRKRKRRCTMKNRKFIEYTPVILPMGFMCLLMIAMIVYGAISKDDITWIIGVVGLQISASLLGTIMGEMGIWYLWGIKQEKPHNTPLNMGMTSGRLTSWSGASSCPASNLFSKKEGSIPPCVEGIEPSNPTCVGRRNPMLIRRNRTNGSSPVIWGTFKQEP